MIRKAKVASLLLALSVVMGCSRSDADLVLINGNIHTLDEKQPHATALASKHGKIVFVGDDEGARKRASESARIIDLRGATVVPGLIDAHGHMRNLGRFLSQVSLVGTTSKDEIIARVREAAATTPKGRWIQGRGWDQNDWDVQVFPTRHDLAEFTDHPVYLRRIDGHAAWVNDVALEIAGITTDTPDPSGGRIVRHGNGEPTGVLVDNAEDLVSEKIPPASDAELDDWMRLAVRHCNELGLVGVHDAGTRSRHLSSYERLTAAGDMSLRVYAMLSADEMGLVEGYFDEGPTTTADGRVVIRSFKMYVDGALGSRGASLLVPYRDDPGNFGLLVEDPNRLVELTERGVEAGFQACAHAIGDRGNRIMLDIYEDVLRGRRPEKYRLRIEHAQVVSLDDIHRFAAIGVVPSMQPTHCTSDMYWAEERVGPERIEGAYAWRTLLDDGNRIPFGSDFPVESANPLWGIYAAITRQDHSGWPADGWHPEQRVTREEALRGFTIDAAWAEFAEKERGTLTKGKRADITVLDRDILAVPPAEILQTEVRYTIVDGDVVYEQ